MEESTQIQQWLPEQIEQNVYSGIWGLENSEVFSQLPSELKLMIIEIVKSEANGRALLNEIKAKDYDKVTELLKKRYINVNIQDEHGRTPLIELISQALWEYESEYPEFQRDWKYSRIEILQMLLDKGANPDLQDKDRETALYLAAGQSDPEIVKMLLDKGANLNLQNKSGKAALHHAAGQPNPEIVKMLLEKGANLNLQDIKGQTALHLAAMEDHPGIVKMLLEAGANPNLQNITGHTALHLATMSGSFKSVRMLLQKGANPDLQDDDGKTAPDYARELWKFDIPNDFWTRH